MSSHTDARFPWLSRLIRGRRRAPRGRRWQSPLLLEQLERRRLLAACSESPAIQGTVFVDANLDGQPDPGEAIAGATVQLRQDDGDGILDTNQDLLVDSQTTDADGLYCLDNLDGRLGYFVVQPSQTVGGTPLQAQASGLIQPGVPNLIIDGFQTSQQVEAAPPPPSSQSNTLAFPNENEVIGAERDLFVELTSGASEVRLRVNPFGLLPVLQFDSTSGVQGRSIVTWDGTDADGNPTPSMGLGGRDLTEAGQNVGFSMNLGVDASGAGQQVTILLYQGDSSNFSTGAADIPVTDGTATAFLFLPFSSFSGPVSPDDVDAIQLLVGEGEASADGQIDVIGVVGPKVQDFSNGPVTDLSIAKTNNQTTLVPGEEVTYVITLQNDGPLNVSGATVQDLFPAELTNVSYTSTTTGNASGNTPAGTGNVNDTVNIDVGASIVYTATATVSPAARGVLTNTATVSLPDGVTDSSPTNNSATDTDTLTPEVDLTVTKTDGVNDVSPGGQLNYTIVVTNSGPSDVQGARIVDTFPTLLTNLSYTSSATGTVSGQTPSGTGHIDDTVSMAVGSQLVYSVTATVSDTASGTISNTVTVIVPDDTTDLNPSDNQATDDTQLLDQVDLIVTKTNSQASAVPNQPLTYTITVTNSGPSDVVGAQLTDVFPAELASVSYTSSAQGGASGNTASGTGNLNETVNLPVGAIITYTVTSTVQAETTQDVANTVTVTPPLGVTETNPSDNTATHVDPLVPGVDLSISKTGNPATVGPGQSLTYTIVVRNNGPNPVTGAQVTDLFPALLTNITYTSQASTGASGNTPSGSGDIDDSLNLAAGSSVTYTVTAALAEEASGSLINTATVTAPSDVTELNPTNNTDSETSVIDSLLARISGFVYVDLDNDGVRDPDEPPIAGVEILLEPEGLPSVPTTTDVTGAYRFENLTFGNYVVQETQPPDFRNGKDTVGGGVGEVVANDTFFVALGSGQLASELNFGELPLQPSKRELLASSVATDLGALVIRRVA